MRKESLAEAGSRKLPSSTHGTQSLTARNKRLVCKHSETNEPRLIFSMQQASLKPDPGEVSRRFAHAAHGCHVAWIEKMFLHSR